MAKDTDRTKDVPDKPTNIAPGDVDHPGKGHAGSGVKANPAESPVEQVRQGGRDDRGKTGPKGANMKGATQS